MYSLESTNARYNDQLDFILPTEGSNANSHTLILARNHHGRNIMFGLGHQGPECFQTFAGVDCLCSSHACKSRERKANSPRRLKTIVNGRPCRSPDYSQHLAIQRHTMQHMQAGKIPETPSTIIWPQSLGFGWRKSWLFFLQPSFDGMITAGVRVCCGPAIMFLFHCILSEIHARTLTLPYGLKLIGTCDDKGGSPTGSIVYILYQYLW